MMRVVVVAVLVIVVGVAVIFTINTLRGDSAPPPSSPPPSTPTVEESVPGAPTPDTLVESPAPPSKPTDTPPPPAAGVPGKAEPPAKVEPPSPALEAERSARFKRAQELLEAGKKMEARDQLTQIILVTPENNDLRARVKGMLDQLNAELFFGRAPTSDSAMYKVEAGDTLIDVARKTNSSADLIRIVNRRESISLRPGQRLKVPQGRFSIIVEKTYFRLMVFFNGQYLKEYPIGHGEGGKTPSATFKIASRQMIRNPSWTASDGTFYRFGDPKNPLGTRWIGFEETPRYSGYGIHGTNDASRIGKEVTNGCVVMYNQDVEELFAMVRPGEEVTIR